MRLRKEKLPPLIVEPSLAVIVMVALVTLVSGAGPTSTETSVSDCVTIRDTGEPPIVTLVIMVSDGRSAVPLIKIPLPSAPSDGVTASILPCSS